MKKLKGSTGAKTAAIILLCVMVLIFIASAVDIAAMDVYKVYPANYEKGRMAVLDDTAYRSAYDTAISILDGEWVNENSNLRLTIEDSKGNRVYDSHNDEAVLWTKTLNYNYYGVPKVTTSTDAAPEISYPDAEQFTINAYVLSDLRANDEIKSVLELYDFGYTLRYAAIAAAVISFILGVLLYVFLLSAAGHRADSEVIRAGFPEKIPYDLFTVFIICGMRICIAIVDEVFWQGVFTILVTVPIVLAAGLLFLWWSMSTAVRAKTGTLWKNTIIWRVLGWCLRGLKSGAGAFRTLNSEIPLFRRGALIAAAVLFVDFLVFMANRWHRDTLTFLWFVEKTILAAGIVYLLWCWVKLRNGAKAVADGDMNASIDTAKMVGELKAHGEDINNIRGGINRAVEERMKSERFRTELITNVSHDIKTPLTSIISYVDLLEKEEPEKERMREYLEVIDRQSARLKKLIDDLMEASKASTGNLNVNLERCEMGVLIDQTAGEYQEKLSEKGLELIIKKPDGPMYIMADGRHIWRIFDNLMNNILKYAQSGTRVYLTLSEENGKALITFRNISRVPLELSGEELTERFVRGDASRSSEGSGLGLSIAKSLAELQNGTMDISVDGDLFKVVLRFPAIQ